MRWRPVLALIVVSAMWGSHPVVGKWVEQQLAPFPLTVWRFTLGALLYLPWYHRLLRVFRLRGKVFWQLALAGLCWSVLYPLLYYQSLRTLTPIEALLLVNSSPLIAALIAWLALRERLVRNQWIGMAISFAGVAVLVLAQWRGSFSFSGGVWALAAAAAFAGYTVSSRSLYQTLPLLDVLVATSLWGVVDLWLVVLVQGKAAVTWQALSSLSPSGWLGLGYIVVIVSSIAYVLYGYGLARLPAAIASALTFYPQVVFAALIQWIGLGLVPSSVVGVSAVLILWGTRTMQRRPPAKSIGQAPRRRAGS